MEQKMTYRDWLGETEIDRVTVFTSDGTGIGIQLWTEGEPFARATVPLGKDPGAFRAWVDTNNNPGMEAFLHENGLGRPCTRGGGHAARASGCCVYPLWELDRARLRELDPEGTAAYERACLKAAGKSGGGKKA